MLMMIAWLLNLLWNSLPIHKRELQTEHSIKDQVSCHLFLKYYHCLGARVAQDVLSNVSIHLQSQISSAVIEWHQAKCHRSCTVLVVHVGMACLCCQVTDTSTDDEHATRLRVTEAVDEACCYTHTAPMFLTRDRAERQPSTSQKYGESMGHYQSEHEVWTPAIRTSWNHMHYIRERSHY